MYNGMVGILHRRSKKDDYFQDGCIVVMWGAMMNSRLKCLKLDDLIAAPITAYGDISAHRFRSIVCANTSFIPYPVETKQLISGYLLDDNISDRNRRRKNTAKIIANKLPVSKRLAVGVWYDGRGSRGEPERVVFLPRLCGCIFTKLVGYNTELNPYTVAERNKRNSEITVLPHLYDDAALPRAIADKATVDAHFAMQANQIINPARPAAINNENWFVNAFNAVVNNR